jgi:hypothetical protein
MDPAPIIDGVLAWVRAVLPELQGGYDHLPAAKDQNLPDAVCDLERTELVQGGSDDRFPYYQLQQAVVAAHTCSVSLMVDNADPKAAADQLKDFGGRLLTDFIAEPNLRGNVPFRSPYCSFDYTPPFVEYADGTRGREMTMTLTIGDLVEVE